MIFGTFPVTAIINFACIISLKRYQLNTLKRAVAKELGEESKGNMCCLSSNVLILQTSN